MHASQHASLHSMGRRASLEGSLRRLTLVKSADEGFSPEEADRALHPHRHIAVSPRGDGDFEGISGPPTSTRSRADSTATGDSGMLPSQRLLRLVGDDGNAAGDAVAAAVAAAARDVSASVSASDAEGADSAYSRGDESTDRSHVDSTHGRGSAHGRDARHSVHHHSMHTLHGHGHGHGDASAFSLRSLAVGGAGAGSVHGDSHGSAAAAAVDYVGPGESRAGHAGESAERSKSMRRSSLSIADTSLVTSLLQRVASEAGAGPKLAMLRRSLEAAADAGGYVDYAAFAAAMRSSLEIDDPALLTSYFRAMRPVVHTQTVMTRIARLTEGTVRDALGFAFSCFDADGDGFIEASDFVNLVQATVTAQAQRRGVHSVDYARLRTELGALFIAQGTTWAEGKLSKSEFEDFILENETALVEACNAASGGATSDGSGHAPFSRSTSLRGGFSAAGGAAYTSDPAAKADGV